MFFSFESLLKINSQADFSSAVILRFRILVAG